MHAYLIDTKVLSCTLTTKQGGIWDGVPDLTPIKMEVQSTPELAECVKRCTSKASLKIEQRNIYTRDEYNMKFAALMIELREAIRESAQEV